MTINKSLIKRIDNEIGRFYALQAWRKDTEDDLHVHMIFTDAQAVTRAKDTVEQNGGTNVRVALAPGKVLCDLWFDMSVELRVSYTNPLYWIFETYRRNRPEPNEWDP